MLQEMVFHLFLRLTVEADENGWPTDAKTLVLICIQWNCQFKKRGLSVLISGTDVLKAF